MTRTFSILIVCLAAAAQAQQPVVLLDPARGGAESGARIADRMPEKQVTLDLAGRLASLLRARGFTVATTREADADVTNDARAAMANNLHPIACILLHATPSGSGVHLYTTALHQKVAPSGTPVRWDEAQAAYADRSHALADEVKAALQQSKVKASVGQTWMRPLDNMQCSAVAVEIAPEKDGTGAEDNSYQARISNALANMLLQWRNRVGSMAPPEPQPAPSPTTAPKPAQDAATASTAKPSGTSAGSVAKPVITTPISPKPATIAKPTAPAKPPPRLPSLDPLDSDKAQP